MNKIRYLKELLIISSIMVWLFSQSVFANLPTVEAPSIGRGSGLMGQIKGYIQDGIVIGGLIIAAIAFINVAVAAIQTFTEVRNERASWTKFGAIIVVGAVLLIAVIWLLSKSAAILL